MKLNVYSCGCTALDVSVVSTCEEHGGYVVSATDDFVPTDARKAFMSDDKQSVLFHTNFIDGMRKLSAGTVGLIFSYPDHFMYTARELVDARSFVEFSDSYFYECRRVLRHDGRIAILVEHAVLPSILYCADQAGFHVLGNFLVPMHISDLAGKHNYQNKHSSFKAGLILSRTDGATVVKSSSLRGFEKRVLSNHIGGHIVDTSCIHYHFIMASRKVSRSIGIVSCSDRYKALKRLLN